MALDNIRERLALFFDAEARMVTRTDAGRYRVEIDMPYRTRARTAEG
jgi:two-component system sensor histidine kinase AlgZ